MPWLLRFVRASSLHSHPLMRLSRLVLLLFLVAQVADGVFTYVAVTALGPGVERNFVLAVWMVIAGPGPTLLVAKGLAVAGGVLVYRHGLHAVLAVLTALYGVMAVGPWIHIFVTWP